MKRMNGLEHALAYVLAVVLMVAAFGAAALFAVQHWSRTNDQGRMLKNEAVIAQQEASLDARLTALAADFGLPEAKLRKAVEQDQLDGLRASVAQWLQKLPEGKAGRMPRIDADTVSEALSEARLPESTPETLYARLAEAFTSAIFPLRGDLLAFGRSLLGDKADVPHLLQLLPYAPWLALLACMVVAALLLLLCARRPNRALWYGGSALTAAALLMGVTLLASLQLSAKISSLNTLAGAELGQLTRPLGQALLIAAAALLAAGLLMLALQRLLLHRERRS